MAECNVKHRDETELGSEDSDEYELDIGKEVKHNLSLSLMYFHQNRLFYVHYHFFKIEKYLQKSNKLLLCFNRLSFRTKPRENL